MKVQSSGNMEMMSSSQSKKKDPTKVKNKNEVRTPSVEIIEIPLETNGKTVELQQVPEIKNQKEKIEKEISVEKETNNVNLEQQKNGTKPEIEESNEIKLVLEDNVITESSKNSHENSKNEEDEVISLSSTISISEISQSNDIVESTSSESIKKSPEKEKEKIEQEQTNDVVVTDDPSFVSYNTSIMLKDVKIKLNDCLRENTKLMESVDENTSISAAFKDLSFGRTLRTISGRSSLGRLRHVTLRKQQMTPNDSLFVNCSGMSGNQDDSINRFASEFPDSFFNGSRTGLKRKIETDIEPSAKKIKQEKQEIGGFFNTSVEYIKNLRRPVQVSTPISSQGYKFDVDDKFNITEDASRIEIDQPTEPKSWCLLM